MNMVHTARRGKTARMGRQARWAAGSMTADLMLIALALVGLALLHWFGGL